MPFEWLSGDSFRGVDVGFHTIGICFYWLVLIGLLGDLDAVSQDAFRPVTVNGFTSSHGELALVDWAEVGDRAG